LHHAVLSNTLVCSIRACNIPVCKALVQAVTFRPRCGTHPLCRSKAFEEPRTRGIAARGAHMLTPVPLLIVPLAIYNIITFLMPGIAWSTVLTTISMLSGAEWAISMAEAFIALSLFFLFFEILKATRITHRSIIDHMLSMLVFVIAITEFLLVRQAGNSVFAILLCIMLLDVIAGFSVSVRVAQRDFSVEPRE
jgi:uncharacterized membrane protein